MNNNKRARIGGAGGGEEEEEDRISDLPDAILEHILCFLGTKFAVRTSVLLKRWRKVWTCVPELNFTSESFSQETSFAPFVNEVLRRRNGGCNVRKVSLFRRRKFDVGLSDNVTAYTLSRGVEHLVLHCDVLLHSCGTNTLPSLLNFKDYPPYCDSLRTLELLGFLFYGQVGFIYVTTLNLRRCTVSNHCSGGRDGDPFAQFPNLINLSLEHCTFHGLKEALKISGGEMLNLSISGLTYGLSLPEGRKVGISAPKLQSLSYSCSEAADFCEINLPSLQHSHVHVPLRRAPSYPKSSETYLKFVEEHNNRSYRNLFFFLQGLCNSQYHSYRT
ncbi:hypothetical protein Tsubulata_034779 [Turnera subulata]|uniref:F-box domain-containing protein n=1 Tax=Turnera subulata TaxID=218843 RepID=A0A9Q0FAG4_9ROSI|nr:hypothetical protein Tsubulata_034779 [Turnera subulata]